MTTVYWNGRQFCDVTDEAKEPAAVTPRAGDKLDFSRSQPGYSRPLADLDLQGGAWVKAGRVRLIVRQQATVPQRAWRRSE